MNLQYVSCGTFNFVLTDWDLRIFTGSEWTVSQLQTEVNIVDRNVRCSERFHAQYEYTIQKNIPNRLALRSVPHKVLSIGYMYHASARNKMCGYEFPYVRICHAIRYLHIN